MAVSKRAFLYHDTCPKCGSQDNLAIYDDGYSKCFGMGCNYYAYDGDSASRPRRRRQLNETFIEGGSRSLPYRGLREEVCKKFGYMVGQYNGETVQIANYRDMNGTVVAQKLRFKDKTFKVIGDMKQAVLFGQWAPVSSWRKIVITEGEIDAMSVSQAQDNKWPVVSIPNGASGAANAIKKELEWLEKFEEIIFMFDNDTAGREAAQQCALLVTPGKAKIAELPPGYKDANDLLKDNRSDDIIRAIWNAKPFRPDGVVPAEDVLSVVLNPANLNGIPYPYRGVTNFTMGLRKQELVTVTAGSGIGKSTFIRELAYHLIRQGERVGYIALEESIQRSALGLIGIHLNKVLHLGQFDDKEEITNAFTDLFSDGRVLFYDHFGSCDCDNLIEKIRYMARGLDCSWIILDHLSIIVSGISEGDERRIIDNTMTRLRSLVQEAGIGMILVSHLKEPDGAKGHEEGAQVSLRHLRGSRAIGQLSDVVIGLERDQQSDDPNITRVRVVKNRPVGKTGVCGYLRYVPETGRLIEEDSVFTENTGENEKDDIF